MELNFGEKKIDFNISNVSSILDIVKDYPTDYVILNSNLNLNASLNYSLNNFEPIIYIDISDNCSVFSWDNKKNPIKNEYFIDVLSKCNLELGLNRDIDDGFVFKDYKNIIIREDLKAIILF